jgi:hypothetical protein
VILIGATVEKGGGTAVLKTGLLRANLLLLLLGTFDGKWVESTRQRAISEVFPQTVSCWLEQSTSGDSCAAETEEFQAYDTNPPLPH